MTFKLPSNIYNIKWFSHLKFLTSKSFAHRILFYNLYMHGNFNVISRFLKYQKISNSIFFIEQNKITGFCGILDNLLYFRIVFMTSETV